MSEDFFNIGPFKTRVVEQPHESRVYVERTQPNENAILAHNAELRKHEQRKMDWGRMVARIPEIAMPGLYREYPDLRSNDRVARGRALQKVLQAHPEWLVVPKVKL
jgi:hypothetical protein